MKGLSRSDEGVWSWDPSAPIRNRGPQTDASSAGPLVPSTAETEVITDITRSKPNVEIKRENIDSLESGDDTLSTQTAVPLSPSSHPAGKLHPLPTPSRALPSSKRLREDPESDTLHAEKRKRVVTATVSADPLPAPDTVTSQLDATGELEHPLWQNDVCFLFVLCRTELTSRKGRHACVECQREYGSRSCSLGAPLLLPTACTATYFHR